MAIDTVHAPRDHRGARKERSASKTIAAIADGVLLVLAGVGVLCVLLAVGAYFLGMQLAMFATGSMSPTIPQGSVALTQKVPASQLKVGEVVTVHRANQLPITHRIVAINDVPGSPQQRSITMRGDANRENDTSPYLVSSADKVLVSVPGAAKYVVWLSQRPVAITVAVILAGIVGWAFWPSRER